MWRELLDYGRQLVGLTENSARNTADIKELRQVIDQLSTIVHDNAVASQHEFAALRQKIQHLRENEILRIENALLRAGAPLPPASLPPAEDQ